MPDRTRTCPRAGCNRTITPDLFACSTHWNALPASVRDPIWRTYRRWKRGDASTVELDDAHGGAYAIWGQVGPE